MMRLTWDINNMAKGVYVRTPNMKTGLHMLGRTAWNKGKKDPNATGRTFSGTWTKEKQKAYGLEWQRKKRASSAEYRKMESLKTRVWQKRNPLKKAWSQYRVTARKKELAFNLKQKDFERLILGDCGYCGIEALPVNGIDRVNNRLGYTVENCASCCSICNQAKHTMTVREFKDWIIRLYNNIKK